MAKKIIFPIIVLLCFLALLTIGLGYYSYTKYYLPSKYPMPPPLADVDFPTQLVQYPVDWPDDLKFPHAFVPVDFSAGTPPDSSAQFWGTKLRFEGKPSEAKDGMAAFLIDKGWTIVESDNLDSGGFMLMIERAAGSGVVVIDPDQKDPSATLVITTIFPE